MDFNIPENLTLSDRILMAIEEAILSGKLQFGEKIVETELARIMKTSKSPVREALKKLEGDGIVKFEARKGYSVKVVDRKSIDDFFEIMFIVEPAAARLALRKMDKKAVRDLKNYITRMEGLMDEDDHEEYYSLNDEFHHYFYAMTENEWLMRFSQMLRKHSRMMRSISLHDKKRFLESIDEHRQIFEAFKDGDETVLANNVMVHLMKFKKNLLATYLSRDNT